MPPLRRSQRRRRTKEANEEEGIRTREKKRREVLPTHHMRSSSADMDIPLTAIQSDDTKLQLEATTQLLNLVSVENNPLISEVIQAGAVPRLVEFLKRDGYPQLQCVAVRVLKNITGGTSENTKVVINCKAVPHLVRLLESSELDTCEQAMWALGNIAGESTRCRNIVISSGALHPLLTLLEENKSHSFLRTGTWTLTNIFEGGPKVPFEQLEFASRVLASLLQTSDEVILKEACWALLHLSNCGGEIKTTMYESGICHKLAALYEDVQVPPSVMFPAVRAIGSIFSGCKIDKRAIEVHKRITETHCKKDAIAKCILKEEKYVWLRFAEGYSSFLYDNWEKLQEQKDSPVC